MIKTLTLTALSVAIGSIGTLGFQDSTNAATLPAGGQINVFFNAVQFNAAGLQSPPGPVSYPVYTAEPNGVGNLSPNGGTNSFLDTLFGPISLGFAATGTNRIFGTPGVTASNPYTSVDVSSNTRDTTGPDAQVQRNFGGFRVGSTGGSLFGLPGYTIDPDSPGRIASVDGTENLTNFGFIEIASTPTTVQTGPRLYEFSLDSITGFNYNPIGGGGLVIGTAPEGDLRAIIAGKIRHIPSGQIGDYVIEFTGQGIRDDGTNGDAVANDGITNPITVSAAIVVVPVPVPEPSTLAFLGAATLLGFGGRALKKRG
jgi:hypothetical protein